MLVFIAVPGILYDLFVRAEQEKRQILLASVQEQGRLMAEGLRLTLEQLPGTSVPAARRLFERMGTRDIRVKLLYRAGDAGGEDAFFFVASAPPIPAQDLEREQQQLVQTGVLGQLHQTCEGGEPLALYYRTPSGTEELLISVSAIRAVSGCWVVVSSMSLDELKGSWIGRPYWQTTEVRTAATIYAVMVTIVLSLFFGVWRGLLRFESLARAIRRGSNPGASFAAQNRMPELAAVADEFDRMVASLRASAQAIRYAAEETAHAFKTPIATIGQALEPLRRALPPGQSPARRALEICDKSLTRLETLVAAARRAEETIAELVNPPRGVVNLRRLVEAVGRSYSEAIKAKNLKIVLQVGADARVRGSEELIETMLENVIDNAVSFSQAGNQILVALVTRRNSAELSVSDEGPGVDPADLERIFERYFSHRPFSASGDGEPDTDGHFGIGLWIVRRNVEAMGGRIRAENRREGGLRMIIDLPLVE